MKRIGIIGGGIIGLFAAYYLHAKGHKVTIFEQSHGIQGTSTGNAGMIVPSHIIPLAAPGMIAKGIRWMFDSKSPFYIKPSLDPDLLRWGYMFYKSSAAKTVDSNILALRDINLLSRRLYQDLEMSNAFDFGFQGHGIIMLYQSAVAEHEELEAAEIANRVGVEARVLSRSEIVELNPGIAINARGAVYYPNDAHMQPIILVRRLSDWLVGQGVEIMPNRSVSSIHVHNGMIKHVDVGGDIHPFDEVVLAAGSWSPSLANKLSLKLPMQAGKGYSIDYDELENMPKIPSILVEAKVAVTPMGNTLRVAGTLEIGGINHRINMNRVKGIVESLPRFYPDLSVNVPRPEQVWSGLRPCSPDGLPYIGRSARISNLIVATGHAMMGVSLAPATGLLVSELVDGVPTNIDISRFRVERFQ